MQFVISYFKKDGDTKPSGSCVRIVNHIELLEILHSNRDETTTDVDKFTVYILGEEVLDWS